MFVYTSLVHTRPNHGGISYGAGAQTAHGAVSELGRLRDAKDMFPIA